MLKRIAALLVAVVGLAGLYFGGSLLPNPLLRVGDFGKNYSQSLKVKAKDLTLVCPGAALAPSKTSSGDGNFNRLGSSVVDYSSNLPGGALLKAQPLTGPAAGRSNLADSGNQVQNLDAVSSVAVTVAGLGDSGQQGSSAFTAQSYQVSTDSGVVGALGANCQNPTPESWLVGGVTTVGRQSLLILANPSSTDATVTLELFGSQGKLIGAGLSGISVSANRTVVLPLAGFAPDQSALAVHVISAGASVASWIQQSTVRGTVAAGADLISPAIQPATELAIPGLLKRGTADATALIAANPDYADLTPAVQVFVPGSQPATVTVAVVGSDSKSTGTVRQEQVPAGSVSSIDIPGLGDGNYSVFISADQPVMAELRMSRSKQGATPPTDYAWLPGVQPLAEAAAVTAPKSGVSKLAIANGGTHAASVVVKDASTGTTQTVTIPKLGSVVLGATAGDVVSVSADQPVSATLVVDFTGQIVAIPLINQRNVGGELQVLVH